jgi:signal-transduction protein with cAMP-binding, CBS, and nucleotidyltransferase domain
MDLEADVRELQEQMDSFSQRLLEQIAFAGVMRQCLTALIASHPAPTRVRDEWQRRLPLWVDRDLDDGSMADPEYGPTTRELLGQLSQEIDAAVDRARGQPRPGGG